MHHGCQTICCDGDNRYTGAVLMAYAKTPHRAAACWAYLVKTDDCLSNFFLIGPDLFWRHYKT